MRPVLVVTSTFCFVVTSAPSKSDVIAVYGYILRGKVFECRYADGPDMEMYSHLPYLALLSQLWRIL